MLDYNGRNFTAGHEQTNSHFTSHNGTDTQITASNERKIQMHWEKIQKEKVRLHNVAQMLPFHCCVKTTPKFPFK
jgi:hypothetical protein